MVPRDRQPHRTQRTLIAAAALAALLTITAGNAALGAAESSTAENGVEKGDAGISATVDAYMRDVDADNGIQPHGYPEIWASPDIRVCHEPVYCDSSQNPIIGATNYLFVTLRNPGPYAVNVANGAIWVYRTTPGGGAAWAPGGGDWTPIGATSVVDLQPWTTTTVMLPWDDVPGPGHFCLLARWVSPLDPMTVETADTVFNTMQNNNITWRNVTSVEMELNGVIEPRPFAIGNILPTRTVNDLVLRPVDKAFQDAGGRVVVDLGPTLFRRWQEGGMRGKGIRQVGETALEVYDPREAVIGGLTLEPRERITFELQFSFRGNTPPRERFGLKVIQFGPDLFGGRSTDRGGVRYDITVGKRSKDSR